MLVVLVVLVVLGGGWEGSIISAAMGTVKELIGGRGGAEKGLMR